MDIPGRFNTGTMNAITDVKGVTVGHCTIIEGKNIRTGVTVIKPHDNDPFLMKLPCAVYAGNGFGKLTGTIQVEELGELESLIGLTNTLSVCQVVQGILNYHIPRMPASEKSINVLVGETNDAYFNDIKGCHVTPEHVARAIEDCSETAVEGCVGAGAGVSCCGFKSGIGTASRTVPGIHLGEEGNYTVGALVQANFGGNLNIYGHQLPFAALPEKEIKGSCMIIVATDAPVDARQLKRIAKRGYLEWQVPVHT